MATSPILKLPKIWPEEFLLQMRALLATGTLVAIRQGYEKITTLTDQLRGPEMTLGVASTFTVKTQLPLFDLALATLPSKPKVVLGSFNALENDLLSPDSPLIQEKMDAVIVLWRLEELLPEWMARPSGLSTEERNRQLSVTLERIQSLVTGFCRQSRAPLFLSSLPRVTPFGRTLLNHSVELSVEQLRLTLNLAILQHVQRHSQVHFFDFDGWVSKTGSQAFNRRMDFFARQPLANEALLSLVAELQTLFTPLIHPSKKVLALDLDNTLWGGVLGEDGIGSLKIGHDFPGNIYRMIQLQALALKDQGVLLVILSKNNHADVVEAFATLSDMPLKWDDFVSIKANWREKHTNLREVARELNLGVDSFVFLDDQPFEQEQMQHHLPEVTVLGASPDPTVIFDALCATTCFSAYRVSQEDLSRSQDYIAQQHRQELEQDTSDKAQFLRALQLEAIVAPVDAGSLGRCVQMLNKTNQFNVTTRRHGEAEIRAMLASDANILLTLSLRDRFADQGIVGLVIGLGDEDQPGWLVLDSFLLSCRALGRGVEKTLWAALIEKASRHFTGIRASFIPTPKNGQCSRLFDDFGLDCIEETEDGTRNYSGKLPANFPFPDWIQTQR